MKLHASGEFWKRYDALPEAVREAADKSYDFLRQDRRHPSLHFKRIGHFWSVRVGLRFRALGIDVEDGILWIWIGSHAEYDQMIR